MILDKTRDKQNYYLDVETAQAVHNWDEAGICAETILLLH